MKLYMLSYICKVIYNTLVTAPRICSYVYHTLGSHNILTRFLTLIHCPPPPDASTYMWVWVFVSVFANLSCTTPSIMSYI